MLSCGYSHNSKGGAIATHFCRFYRLYYEGAKERQRKRQSERGKEMFGFRVGKFLALGIVPDGQSPSLYKQFLLLLLSVFPLTHSHLFTKWHLMFFFGQCRLSPELAAESFTHSPKFLPFPKSTQHQMPSWLTSTVGGSVSNFLTISATRPPQKYKRKVFQKTKKNQNKQTKNANQTRYFYQCVFRTKNVQLCYEDRFFCGYKMVINVFLFLFFFLRESVGAPSEWCTETTGLITTGGSR